MCPPTVARDPGLMRPVLNNLLSNAIKYTRRRKRAMIQINQLTTDGEPAIFVRDNGAGFDPRHTDNLFGVFQRLHSADEFEGTGVGLATVQRIIQKRGGRVWVESEVNKGTTFYFTLGRVAAEICSVPEIIQDQEERRGQIEETERRRGQT
ncbi:MAG TPA: ATP-binding protein [Terriglobia bacterium]|nr:ATP-binding protein [Terriglobia bacterium]